MPAVKCPLCGSRVRIENSEIYTRFHCSKCHTTSHLNAKRVPVVGNPPDMEQELARLKQEVREKWQRVPLRKILGGLAALVVVYLVISFVFRPASTLDRPAEKAGQALVDNDLAYLQSIAAKGTADDLARWFESIQPTLEMHRASWHGRPEKVDVHLGEEDPDERRKTVVLSIHPAGPSSVRDVTLADPTIAMAPADGTFALVLVWTRSRWGGWKLDGTETYTKTQPVMTMFEANDP